MANTNRKASTICLACHEGRLSTILETASEFRFLSLCGRECRPLSDVLITAEPAAYSTLSILQNKHVDLLLCGGITLHCREVFERHGIRVIGWLRGDVEDVRAALASGKIAALRMPGCRAEISGRGRGYCCRKAAGKRNRK